MPFLLNVSQGCEFRGVIDRLFWDRDKDCWSIIDWKSNDLLGKDPADVVEENGYNLQLACYKWAAERLLDQEVGDVYIYFTDKGHLHKSQWEGDPGDLIETMLERIRECIGSGDQRVSDLIGLKGNETDCRSCEYRELPCKIFSPSVSNF
ncbi:MAG: PD-(D/E)XK nuclease family protein [Deltaproteobacteria bacterium]|nr:PD-(D/E)XK nuclease family protein [Deltaproteobacteria bacterium]